MSNKRFLVPHDFTEVADCALGHACGCASTVGAEVHLLHVVGKDKAKDEAMEKLQAIIDRENQKGNKTHLEGHVRTGNIFDDIGDFASENRMELIFMGTHGAHGWQHIAGSHALKVITHSKVPFIVVQNKEIKENGYDDIVVPLDLHKETKQKLALVANMAKYFNSKVHVITPNESDEFLRHKVLGNIKFAEKFFTERGIEMDATLAPSSGFDKEVVKYAINVDADLIAIMNHQKNSLLGLLGSNYEQYMITNDAKIPVMTVNPVQTTVASSVLFS